jgi:hypothetical protein
LTLLLLEFILKIVEFRLGVHTVKFKKPVLVVDSNPSRQLPYTLLSENYGITRVVDLQSADFLLEKEDWALVIICTSFPLPKKLTFLEKLLKLCSTKSRVIPLVWLLDWNTPIIELPGSSWGDQLACWPENISHPELTASLQRLGV